MLSYDRLIIRMQYTKYAGEESMVNGVMLWHGTELNGTARCCAYHVNSYDTVWYGTLLYDDVLVDV